MAAAFESGVHENIEHLFGIAVADKAGRYAKNVGVVMFAGQFGQFFAPADGGPDALVLMVLKRVCRLARLLHANRETVFCN